MNVIIANSQTPCHQQLLDEMFALRKRVFHDELGWDVNVENGLEVDRFDSLDPDYFMIEEEDGSVFATARLLPTTGPYMLGEVFPQLLAGETLPRSPEILEVSRLAIDPSVGGGKGSQASMSLATLKILREGELFGLKNGITHFVFVTSVAVERMLKRLGLNMWRMGDGSSQIIGKVRSVACWKTCSESNLTLMNEAIKQIEKMLEAA